LNKCPDDAEEKSKNGSSFLVLNTQDSSDDETELTISHDHIAAAQESDSCDEDSVKDIEESNTEDEDLETEDPETKSKDEYGGFAFTQQDVLCSFKTKLVSRVAGSYLTVSQPLMCSLTQNY
jgi:hypothetical protein